MHGLTLVAPLERVKDSHETMCHVTYNVAIKVHYHDLKQADSWFLSILSFVNLTIELYLKTEWSQSFLTK